MSFDGVKNDQAALRRRAVAARAAIPPAERAIASQQAAKLAIGALGAEPGAVAAFLSFRDEIDTAPLLDAVAAGGLALCLPVVEGKGKPLIFKRFLPGDRLETGAYGIKTPIAAAPLVMPDTLFVPLAAFDRQGQRIGYGGGYYDRTLHQLRQVKPIRAFGYAFAAQEVAAIPAGPHDERLDAIISEREVIVPRVSG